MHTIGVFSLHGSPGVTVLSLALAAQFHAAEQRSLLIEADPDGGVIAARFDAPLTPNLTDLAAAARRALEPEEVLRYAQAVGNGTPVVLAHPSGEQTRAALSMGAGPIAAALAHLDGTTVMDLGRWRSDSPSRPFFDATSRLLLVMRPTLEQAVQVLHLVDALDNPQRLALVLIGSRPYSARRVSDTTGLPVLATLPDFGSPGVVDPLTVEPRRRDRWPRAVRDLVVTLRAAVPDPTPN